LRMQFLCEGNAHQRRQNGSVDVCFHSVAFSSRVEGSLYGLNRR
jgi:hypothetical protein